MLPFLQGSFGNPSGQHAAARVAKTAVEEAREQVAVALGAKPAEIVFTGGGTEADNLAIKGAARSARDRGLGDGVVTTAVEHHAGLHSCDRLGRDGVRGPRGVGPLVVRPPARLVPVIDGGGQERDLRSGTHNVAGIVGMAAALTATVARRAEEAPRVAALRDRLAARIAAGLPDGAVR